MNKNMEYSFARLADLPDEILLIIFQQLNKVLLLYSLSGLNQRLNRIVYDPYFTYSCLTMLRCYSDDDNYPLPDQILDKFCSQILPEIHHNIKWLHLEQSSMIRILLSAKYPNLYGLTLYHIEKETAKYFYTGKTFYFEILQLLKH
jgi:hypothetical protein